MTGLVLGLSAAGIGLLAFRQWFRLAFRQRNTHFLPFVATMTLVLVLGIAAWFFEPGIIGGLGAVVGLLLSGFYLLTSAVGKQRSQGCKIVVGEPLPAFSALTDSGATFHSSELDGRPFLLKFFRGHW